MDLANKLDADACADGHAVQRGRSPVLERMRATGMSPDSLARRIPELGRDIRDVEAGLFGSAGGAADLASFVSRLTAAESQISMQGARRAAPPTLYPSPI